MSAADATFETCYRWRAMLGDQVLGDQVFGTVIFTGEVWIVDY